MNDNEPQVNDITNSKKNDNRELKMLTVIMTVLLIVLDQISKFLVVSRLGLYDKVTVIKGFFYIDHVRNTGSAFSFLADKSWGIYVLSGISVLMAAVILSHW